MRSNEVGQERPSVAIGRYEKMGMMMPCPSQRGSAYFRHDLSGRTVLTSRWKRKPLSYQPQKPQERCYIYLTKTPRPCLSPSFLLVRRIKEGLICLTVSTKTYCICNFFLKKSSFGIRVMAQTVETTVDAYSILHKMKKYCWKTTCTCFEARRPVRTIYRWLDLCCKH